MGLVETWGWMMEAVVTLAWEEVAGWVVKRG